MQLSSILTLFVSLIAVATPVAAGKCCSSSCGVCDSHSSCNVRREKKAASYRHPFREFASFQVPKADTLDRKTSIVWAETTRITAAARGSESNDSTCALRGFLGVQVLRSSPSRILRPYVQWMAGNLLRIQGLS